MKLSIMNLYNRSDRTSAEADKASANGAPGWPQSDSAGRNPSTAPIPEDHDTLQSIRQRILNRIFVVASLLGLVAFMINLPLFIQEGDWLVLGLYSFFFGILVLVAFQTRLAYPLRATILLIFLYAIGLLALLDDGLFGSGRVFLLSLPFFAAILMGSRGGVLGLLFSIGSMIVIGLLMSYGLIPAPLLRSGAGNNSLLSWLVASANFSLLIITGVVSLSVVIESLEKSLSWHRALTRQVERTRDQLEIRMAQRMVVLERRLVQIRTAAEITRTISQVSDIEELLSLRLWQICELMCQRFDLYYVGIFLIQGDVGETGSILNTARQRYAVLRAGSGGAGQRMVADGHRLLVGGDSMIGWATANCQARIALDTGQEAVRFNNPYLPNTRSEMALPIVVQEARLSADGPGRPGSADSSGEAERRPYRSQEQGPGAKLTALGAISIQSEKESAFDKDDIIVLQGIADTLATALLNARLLATMRANLQEISSLHRQYLQQAWTETVQEQGELEFTYQDEQRPGAQDEAAEPDAPPAVVAIPIRLRDTVIGDLTLEFDPTTAAERIPDPNDPNSEHQAVIEAVMNQAALALENARLLDETRRRAERERVTATISSRVWSSSNIDTILRATLEEISQSMGAIQGEIRLWSQSEEEN
jgi:GAF domain-containing protein